MSKTEEGENTAGVTVGVVPDTLTDEQTLDLLSNSRMFELNPTVITDMLEDTRYSSKNNSFTRLLEDSFILTMNSLPLPEEDCSLETPIVKDWLIPVVKSLYSNFRQTLLENLSNPDVIHILFLLRRENPPDVMSLVKNQNTSTVTLEAMWEYYHTESIGYYILQHPNCSVLLFQLAVEFLETYKPPKRNPANTTTVGIEKSNAQYCFLLCTLIQEGRLSDELLERVIELTYMYLVDNEDILNLIYYYARLLLVSVLNNHKVTVDRKKSFLLISYLPDKSIPVFDLEVDFVDDGSFMRALDEELLGDAEKAEIPNYRFLPKEWLIALLWGSEDARSRYLTEQT